jgi:hypothetical protein
LKLDVVTANRAVLRWLDEVANARLHATTGIAPRVRLAEDQAHFSALPSSPVRHSPLAKGRHAPIPIESLQHPLSVYDSLLEVAA